MLAISIAILILLVAIRKSSPDVLPNHMLRLANRDILVRPGHLLLLILPGVFLELSRMYLGFSLYGRGTRVTDTLWDPSVIAVLLRW